MNIQFHRYNNLKYQFVCKYMKKNHYGNLDGIWTEFGQNLDLILERIKEKIFSGNLNDSILVKFLIYRRLSELSESLNVLSDIHFHLKDCINIQF